MSESGISFRVGVTGHRDILPEDVDAARQHSHELLSSLKSAMPATRITVISGLAEGADRIFAEAALALNMTVEAVMPMPLKYYKNDFNIIRQATVDELIEIEGYGGIIAASISNYFINEHNEMIIDDLLSYIQFNVYEENTNEQKLEGKTFVITGSVEHYKNRKELKTKNEE